MSKWIKPKKQLPEEEQWVVVTFMAGGFRQYQTMHFFRSIDLQNGVLCYAHIPVKAWMPFDEYN